MILVPREGLEPSRSCDHGFLRPARIPIPPPGQKSVIILPYMFCDEVTVHFKGGRGGNGCVSFRREKYVPRGGPNGGDGGNGGSIYLQANENINTLAEFSARKNFRAQSGQHGFGKQMAGKTAPDLIVPVPLGTMILDAKKKKLLRDVEKHGDIFLIARGGRGGYGNAHFKSSTRQAPTFAELGEPGEEKICVLELKLVADVGIIGLPSVGKSTLLSRISNARPRIADYPFTTLVPNLGLVTLKEFGGSLKQNFLACDLPGLIEGAHQGKGLGIQFLKHVARNRVLVHLLDVNSLDPSKDYRTIFSEMKAFDSTLTRKSQVVVFNKIDTVSGEALKKIITEFKKKNRRIKNVFAISCVSGNGLKDLLFAVWDSLERPKEPKNPRTEKPAAHESFKIFRPEPERSSHTFTIKILKKRKKQKSIFLITGPRIEQIVVMTNFRNPQAVARVYDVCEKMRIVRELRQRGAKFGDDIIIGKETLTYRWE